MPYRTSVLRTSMALAAALTMSSCGSSNQDSGAPPDQPSPGGATIPAELTSLSDADRQRLASEILTTFYIRRYTLARGNVSTEHDCSEKFSLGTPAIADALIAGPVGKVTFLVPVVAIADDSDQFASICWTKNIGGPWVKGQALRLSRTFAIEKWDTGWKLSRNNPVD